jgi:hypothetical protein
MTDLINTLKVDPITYVTGLNSPIGVYLREKVFLKTTRSEDGLKKELYEKTVSLQSADGSWNQLFVQTANSLWNLSLMGYNLKDPNIKKGLDWLLSIQKYDYGGLSGWIFHSNNRKESRTMRSTFYGEFVPGCTISYETTYATHLLLSFGLGDIKPVQKTVKSYLQVWGNRNWVCGALCGSNVFRVLIEHPISRDSHQVENGLKFLALQQTKNGSWKFRNQTMPFYHTFHALSRSKHTIARQQIKNALPIILRAQNKDGSWGKSMQKKETLTFLALDALKNI